MNKRPILIDQIDINKRVVSNKVSFHKNYLKYFIGYKDARKLDLHAYYFQKYVYMEEILIKLNGCLF